MPKQNLDRQHFMHNFFRTKKTPTLPDNEPFVPEITAKETYMEEYLQTMKLICLYVIWMKKLICQNSSRQINLFQYSFNRSFPACTKIFPICFQDSGKIYILSPQKLSKLQKLFMLQCYNATRGFVTLPQISKGKYLSNYWSDLPQTLN